MSESETNTDDTNSEEGGASQAAPNQSVQQTQVNQGSGFLSNAEQTVIKEWVLFVTGFFVAVSFAVGLNAIIQDQWSHFLISSSGGGTTVGQAFGLFSGLGTVMTLSVASITVLGYVFANAIANEDNTAYKVAIIASLVVVPVASIIVGVLWTQPANNASVEFVNVIVSGLGSGIAAAIGASIVILLTENQAPEVLRR